MTEYPAIDTNVFVYCHTNDEPYKQKIATELLDVSPMVSTQVLSEYFNVIKRKFPLTKAEIFDVCLGNVELCQIYPVVLSTLRLAQKLTVRYDLQMFDSIVIAAALEANCDTLYSEDMQNGLIVEKQLKIINPFI